jgi:hypothetical protein
MNPRPCAPPHSPLLALTTGPPRGWSKYNSQQEYRVQASPNLLYKTNYPLTTTMTTNL